MSLIINLQLCSWADPFYPILLKRLSIVIHSPLARYVCSSQLLAGWMVPLHSPLAMQDCYDGTWSWSTWGMKRCITTNSQKLQIVSGICVFICHVPEHWLCLSTLLSPPSFVPRRSCLAASSSDITAYTSTKHRETRPPVQAWTRVWRIALVRSCHIHAKKATWWSSRNSVQCRKRICTDTWKWTLNVANSTLGPRPYQNLVQEHGMCLTFFGGGDSRKL